MGYWDIGPFDNDYALDFLDEFMGLPPAEVEHRLEGVLNGTRPSGFGKDVLHAACGLIIAVAGEVPQEEGTNLGEEPVPNDLGLGRALEAFDMLSKESALRLLPIAVTEIRNVASEEDWENEGDDSYVREMNDRLDSIESYARRIK